MALRGSISFVIQALNQVTENTVKVITLDATSNLIEDTPRKTSWARSNWIPNLGGTSRKPKGSPENVQAAIAAQQGGIATIITSYKLSLGKVFVTNNVPYILPLNDGSSKQAPAGFVQVAIFRAVRRAAGDVTITL